MFYKNLLLTLLQPVYRSFPRVFYTDWHRFVKLDESVLNLYCFLKNDSVVRFIYLFVGIFPYKISPTDIARVYNDSMVK